MPQSADCAQPRFAGVRGEASEGTDGGAGLQPADNTAGNDTAIVYEGEEKVMVELLDAWKPYTWPKPDNISSPLEHCAWDGITCNAQGDVTRIRLTVKDVEGTIPASVGQLQHMEQFYLYSNFIRGTIPPELGMLSKLTHLSLGENKIRGTVPAEIGNLSSLTFLYLNGNSLRGTIPKEIGKLTKLQHLGLWTNAFEVRACALV